jgi:hypothetical protein
VTAQQNIEFGEGQSGVFGKPGEGPASAPLAGVRLMVVPAMRQGAAVAASVASGAAVSVALAAA